MLESIRSRSSGIFAWFVASLIIVTMALFGVNTYVSDQVDQTLFEAGDEKVSYSDYQQALQIAQRRALSQSAEIDTSSLQFRRNVLRQLIQQAIARDTIEQAGYAVADETIGQLVLDNTTFQVDGKFDEETYNQFIASNFGSEQRYWELLKDSLKASQVASGLVESSMVNSGENDFLLSLIAEQRTIDLVRLNVDEVVESVNFTNEQLEAFYQENVDDYQEPEKVSVEYLVLNAKQFEDGIKFTDDDLLAIYERDLESYSEPEYRDVRHILFTGADAEQQAQDTLLRLEAGEAFAKLAEELSQDPGSAVNGGDLGEVARGQMVAPFEEAAYALELNKVSEPVSTEFGIHLIEVTKITGGEQQPFDEVKESIRSAEVARMAEDVYFEKLEDLRNDVFENENTLQIAADNLGVSTEKSAFFTRNEGEGLFNNPAIRSAAFSDNVLFENKNSEVIDVTPTEVMVLRKVEYVEQQPRPLEEVKEVVTAALKNELAREQVIETLENAHTQLLDKQDWQAILGSNNLSSEPKVVSYLEQESGISFTVLSDIFSLSDASFAKQIGKSIDGFGNGYLYKLNEVKAGDISQVDKEIAELIRNDIGFRNSVSVSQSYLSRKIDDAMASIDEDLL